MSSFRTLAVLALVMGCGKNDDKDGTNCTDSACTTGTAGSRFEEFINVDKSGVEVTGDLSGVPAGDNTWEGTPWLTQTIPSENTIDVNASGMVEDFQDEIPVAQATVELWFDDVIDGTTDAEALSDNSGLVSIPAKACQKMAYRVTTDPAITLTKTTYKAHHIYPPEPDGTVDDAEFVSVSDTTYRLIPTILGVVVDPDKAIIAGTAYDFARDPATTTDIDTGKIEGAQVIVYDQNGNIPESLTVNYFTENFPDRDQKWTSPDGLWVAANVPEGTLRAEMWGVVGGELTLLGATVLDSEKDSINISNIFAGYGDGVKYPFACEGGGGTGSGTGTGTGTGTGSGTGSGTGTGTGAGTGSGTGTGTGSP